MHLEDFRLKGGIRKTLIVLGAGASRGASFVKNKYGIMPPLDIDFFQQLSRLYDCKEATNLIKFIRKEYGTELGLSMESFFSEAEYTNRFHNELKIDKGAKIRAYENALKLFYVSLAELIKITTLKKKECEYHNIIAKKLDVNDTIISFNYDCIIDNALKTSTGNKWDPQKGYGFKIRNGAEEWKEKGRGKTPKGTINLLKMHGSFNFKINENEGFVDLVSPENLNDINDLENSIIPPTWFKDYTKYPYNEIWKEARKSIRSSRIIVIIGYSVPQTDLFSKSLFKVEIGSKEKRGG